MSGVWTIRKSWIRQLLICISIATGALLSTAPALAVVKIFDGFEDADRNNDGSTLADTDLNDSGTLNDPTSDAALVTRGITEVTAATNAGDTGIVWSGTRAYDSGTNLVKSKLRIINDNVPHGVETSADIHNHGLALGVESRGGGSSFIGKFGQSIAIGPVVGDKVVVSVDWRVWREANDNLTWTLVAAQDLRWGLWQDTDQELGSTGPFGNGSVSAPPGATVEWGKDDGNWFGSQPGAEGDKGIYSKLEFGNLADPLNARINWEYNSTTVGTANNGRFFQGNGVNATNTGGDVGVVAQASVAGNGTGGIISNLSTYAPHTLSMEFTRVVAGDDGMINVKTLVDGVDVLHDDIKTTDTGYAFIGPPADTFDYVGFTNATGDWDYAIDNFKVEVFGSNAVVGVAGDYNNNGTVDAADYVLWRNGGPLQNEVSGVTPGTVTPEDYDAWKTRFGNTSGSSAGLGSVPEPASATMFVLLVGGLLAGSLRTGRQRQYGFERVRA